MTDTLAAPAPVASPAAAAVDAGAMVPLAAVVAAHDAAMAREFADLLEGQRWPSLRIVHPVSQAVADARASGAMAVFLSPGTTLAPHALESAWWALDTRPDIGYVAFGDERGARTPMLEAVATCVVVRGAWLTESACNSDRRWAGIAPLFGMLESSRPGHLIRDPLVTRSAALLADDAPVRRAVLELRAKGLSDAVLGDTGRDPVPPREPLQTIDERPLPLPGRTPAPARHGASRHRVLALLQGFPMGGYAAFNADFLPRLVARGHAVTVCTTELWRTDWRLDGVRRATGDVVHACGVVSLSSMPRYVSYLIASRDIDVVFISHSLAGYRMLAWLRRRHPGTAFLDYVHTDWFEAQMYGSYATLGAAHAEWLDVQVASSAMLARELVHRGSGADTTCSMTINLDVKDWDPERFRGAEVRRTLGCRKEQPLILFAGRLSSEKRPLLAVECWKGLVDSGVDARFAVAGAGPLLGAMMAAVAAAGLADRVEFLGELEGDMLRYVYSAANVYHAPSEIEGIARALFEAMAMQCVPVVADVGGQHELVTDACGVLVPHGPDEVARYVAALTAVTAPVAMNRMASASRARIVQHFTSAACVAGFESAFDRAVATRRGNGEGAVESAAAARELAVGGLDTQRRHFWRAQGA